MVEALANGEGRSLAYGGNSPTEVWHRSQEDDSAARVALRAMVECLRHALFHREAKRIIESIGFGPHTIVPMSRPPELLDLPILRAEERVAAGCPLVILHPDPQLNVQEQNVLFNHDRNLKLLTPATALAGAFSHSGHVPLDRWRVGMSLADSPDADGPEGYMQEHVRDITVSLARTLVASGAALAYGGDFRSGGYTEILSKLVEGWNRTARRPVDLLHCYIAAHCDPLHGEKLVFTAHHLAQASGLGQSALLSPPTAKDVPAHRCSLYVSEMRKVMEHELQARVLIGGNTRPRSLGQTPQEGYGGRFPGIVEEAWQSLRHNTPLYVIGGFGGATALVAQLLSGTEERVPEALCERSWQHESWRCLSAAHDADPDARKLGLPRSLDALASAVRELGRRHLACDEAAQAWNGLTCAENRQLFCSRDTITIAALVLKGLLQRRAHQTDRQLKIELVPGDIACASGLDVIAFPVFSDMELQGAGAALDAASSGAATDSQRSGGLVANRGERVGTGFLYAADLGSVNEALANPEPTVQRAAQRTAAVVRRYGFGQVGIVAFLGNTLEQIEQVVAPMLSGLRTLSDVSIAWFERDAKRFAALEKLLGERSDVTLSTRAPTQPAASSPTPRERTYVPVRQLQREELEVAVLMPHSNGLWPSTPRTLTLEERQELVGPQNARAPEARELNRRGQRMLEILFGADPVEVLNPLHANELVIAHDAEAAGLPYEALCWRDPVTDCWVRPAAKLGIVRRLKAPGIPLRCGANRPPSNHLKVLLVVNPTGNLKGADHEAADILRSLASVDIKPAVLRHDQATVAGVCQALNQEAVDVLHYCGHAFFEGEGPGESGLYCADGPLTHEHLRALPPANMPRLAFVNGCQGGRVRSTAPAASSEAQAFAEFFLRGGVDAYLGTFWVLSDPGASMFAKTVYRALIDGSELGAAVIAGRQVLIENGNPDWANYVLYGDSGFRLLRPASAGGEHAHH
jgi:hypothetical protein